MRNAEIEHKTDFNLMPYNTLRISSIAQDVYFPDTKEEFILLLANLEALLVIGCGSNILLSSTGIEAPVIITKHLNKINVKPPYIEAETGVPAPKLAEMALELKLTGLEFLTALPATIGGAVCMNAGAMEQTVQDVFVSAEVYDSVNDVVKTFTKEDMQFEYRNSILKNQERYFLLSVKFKLNESADYDSIQNLMDKNKEKRRLMQPNLSEPNLGCVFKNPKGDSAGRLLDECNLKSHLIGGAKVSHKHANFIINFNNTTSLDYLMLMQEMQQKVEEKFNIRLKPEIIYAGHDKKELEIWKCIQK